MVSVELHRTVLLMAHPPQPKLTHRTPQLSARGAGGCGLHSELTFVVVLVLRKPRRDPENQLHIVFATAQLK